MSHVCHTNPERVRALQNRNSTRFRGESSTELFENIALIVSGLLRGLVGRVGIEPTTFGLRDSYKCPTQDTPGLTRPIFAASSRQGTCPQLSWFVPNWPPVECQECDTESGAESWF